MALDLTVPAKAQVMPTKKYPLVIEFTLQHPALNDKRIQAGFRDWEHYLAYVRQMQDSNAITVRHPVQVRVLQ